MKNIPRYLTHRGAAVIKHDYLEEIGISSVEKKLSWPSAIAIIAVVSIAAITLVAWARPHPVQIHHAAASTHKIFNSANHWSGAAKASSGPTRHGMPS